MSFKMLSSFTDLDGKVVLHDDSGDNESAIERTVFGEELWEDMKAGKTFHCDVDAGYHNTLYESSKCIMERFIMAHAEGKSLKEILGEGVDMVTQRSFLIDCLEKQMGLRDKDVEMSCELFNGVKFVMPVSPWQLDDSQDSSEQRIFQFRSLRVKNFNGPDLPGCVGKVPAKNFAFPNIDDMYSVNMMTDANGKKVICNGFYTRYSPEGETVDSRAIDIDLWTTKNKCFHKQKGMRTRNALQARLACMAHFVFMFYDIDNKTVKAEVRSMSELNQLIESYPKDQTTLNTALMFLKVEEFLLDHGRCKATLEKGRYGWQFVPRLVDADYKSFLSQEFRDRFAEVDPDRMTHIPSVRVDPHGSVRKPAKKFPSQDVRNMITKPNAPQAKEADEMEQKKQ